MMLDFHSRPHETAPITPFVKRVRVLFGAGLDTAKIAEQIALEQKTDIPEHAVYNALACAMHASKSGDLKWPYVNKKELSK